MQSKEVFWQWHMISFCILSYLHKTVSGNQRIQVVGGGGCPTCHTLNETLPVSVNRIVFFCTSVQKTQDDSLPFHNINFYNVCVCVCISTGYTFRPCKCSNPASRVCSYKQPCLTETTGLLASTVAKYCQYIYHRSTS